MAMTVREAAAYARGVAAGWHEHADAVEKIAPGAAIHPIDDENLDKMWRDLAALRTRYPRAVGTAVPALPHQTDAEAIAEIHRMAASVRPGPPTESLDAGTRAPGLSSYPYAAHPGEPDIPEPVISAVRAWDEDGQQGVATGANAPEPPRAECVWTFHPNTEHPWHSGGCPYEVRQDDPPKAGTTCPDCGRPIRLAGKGATT